MFLYPEHALVDRVLPKNKIYGNAQPSRAIRQRFVNEWIRSSGATNWRRRQSICRPKLASRRSRFSISRSKQASCGKMFCGPSTAQFRRLSFFELTFQGKVRFCAAYKRVSEAACQQLVVDAYFETPWQDAATPRAAAAGCTRPGQSLRADVPRQLMRGQPACVERHERVRHWLEIVARQPNSGHSAGNARARSEAEEGNPVQPQGRDQRRAAPVLARTS